MHTHARTLPPSLCLMFSSDTNSEPAAGRLRSLLKQQAKARMGGGMAERPRADDELHMIYIRERKFAAIHEAITGSERGKRQCSCQWMAQAGGSISCQRRSSDTDGEAAGLCRKRENNLVEAAVF